MNIAAGVLIVLAIVWYARPRSFEDIMPGFDPDQINECQATYFVSGVDEGKPTHDIQTRSFAWNSDDYQQLLALLASTTHRRQCSNFFTGGSLNAYSVRLNLYAEIYFYQGNQRYEFSLFGQDVPAGPMQDRYDYTPWGGRDFQNRGRIYRHAWHFDWGGLSKTKQIILEIKSSRQGKSCLLLL